MKVLQINKYFYHKGGAESVFFNTIDLLRAKGNIVIPFSVKNIKNKDSDYSSYFIDFPELSESRLATKVRNLGRFIYNTDAAKKLEELILKEKPDIAHIHLLFNSFSVALLPVFKKYRIPVVMTVHDYRLVCPAYLLKNGRGDICEKCVKSASYWHCTTNRCANNSLPNSILLSLESYFRKYFVSPIDYIDHFIFVSNFSRNKHLETNISFKEKSSKIYNFSLIKEVDICEKQDYILYFGRLSNEKGLQTLLDAVKDLASINLKIIGDGPLLQQLTNNASDNVQFLGYKSGEELLQHIQKAKFVIVPSECYENNPMTIIEAMTLGTPVIGSNIGGIPELIIEGKTGFLFEAKSSGNLKEMIQAALNYPIEKYILMVSEAMKFAKENFMAEPYYEKIIKIYDEVIQKYSL